MKPEEQSLLVALRVRPMNNIEHNCRAKTIAHPVDKNLVVLLDPNEDNVDILRANRSREKKYVFDQTFDCNATQTEVYQSTAWGVISSVVSGYNATVFAYGATGTGKTYTMLGTENEPGIMVLTLNDLFEKIEETREDMIYRVTMSYLEIYNEMIRDLLNPSDEFLELREDSNGAVMVTGLLEVDAVSTTEIVSLLSRGNTRRTCEPTAINKTSSRSHAVLKVTVKQRSRVMNVLQEVRTGVLFMIDLAGSERAAITQNRGKRMIEGAHINRSLLALGNCINALGGNNKAQYVNYRDSKLTRLLKDSLGGNCRTVMIAHVSPASTSFEESRNTLTYAERSTNIKTKVHQNVTDVSYHITQYHTIIAELRRKVQRLQEQLLQAKGKKEGGKPRDMDASVRPRNSEEREVEVMCGQLKALLQEEKEIRQELLAIECHLLQNALERQRHLACIREWEHKRPSISLFTPLGRVTEPERSCDGHMTKSLAIVTEEVDPCDTESDDTHVPQSLARVTETDESCDSDVTKQSNPCDGHMTKSLAIVTEEVDPCDTESDDTHVPQSLARVTETDESCDSDVTKQSNPCDSHMTEKVDSCVTQSANTEQQCDSHVTGHMDPITCLSPDSGAEVSSVPTMEPFDVSLAREEVATLVADKQRMEAQHKRLERRLKENRAKGDKIHEHLSASSSLLPLQQQLVELLQYCSEVEGTSLDHSLAAALTGLQLTRRESAIEQLLKHCTGIMELVEQQRGLMEEHSVAVSVDVTVQYRQLAVRQKTLSTQIEAEKQLPPLSCGKELQLPTIARLSAKLYTTMTGSKSNLLVEEGATSRVHTPVQTTNALHLPKITSSPGVTHQSLSHPQMSTISLPPILPHPPSLVAKEGTKSELHSLTKVISNLTSESNRKPPTSPIKTSLALLSSKVSSLTTPRISVSRCSSNKSKYIVGRPTRRDILARLGQTKVNKSSSQPQLPHPAARRRPARGAALKPVLSDATRKRLERNRVSVTIEELVQQSSSNQSTPLHKTGSNVTVRSTTSTKSKAIPLAKSIPAARKEVNATRTKPPQVQRKKPAPTRQELALSKVNASGHFADIVSPYLTSMKNPRTSRREGPSKKSRSLHQKTSVKTVAVKPFLL